MIFGFPGEIKFLFLSVLLFAIAMGVDLVCFPAIMNNFGFSPTQIGVSFAIELLGGITASFLLSKFVSKFGILKSLLIGSILFGCAVLSIYFCSNFFIWIIFSFFIGAFWFVYVITRQSWLNILLTDQQRGLGLGILSMLISVGIAIGPAIVRFSGATNYLSFIISAILTLFSVVCLMHLKSGENLVIDNKRIPLLLFFRKNPLCVIARFCMDFQIYLLLTFTVVFGLKIGISSEEAGLLISAYTITGFIDVIIGMLLKNLNPYRFIKYGFVGAILTFIVIIFYHHNYWLLLVLYFIYGISIACMFVSIFKIINDSYDKHNLVAANATFQLVGSCGSLCGAVVGGGLVELFGVNGFPLAIIFVSSFYLLSAIYFSNKKNV